MALKFGEHYLRVTHGVGKKPFIVAVHESSRKGLREKFPDTVIYSQRELAYIEAAGAAPELVQRVHNVKEIFPDATVFGFSTESTEKSKERDIFRKGEKK